MKIDSFTVSVLENFASINSSIFVREGNVLETISPSRTIKARAEVETVFPRDFAFYNLWKFISVLGLHKDPDVSFEENLVHVSSGVRNTQLPYSEESLVEKVSPKKVNFPSIDVTTFISATAMKDIDKARKILKFEDIIISGDGKNLFLSTADTSNPTGDIHTILLGDNDRKFQAIFKADNLLLLPGDYDVEISKEGISKFKSERLEYYIAVEEKSTF